MTFEDFVNVNAGSSEEEVNVNVNLILNEDSNLEGGNVKEGNDVNESFAVKISFGNDIRRASCSASYNALSELVAKLFQVDQASVVLKYRDDDGDKITMSSDSELQEAIRLAKEKNIVHLFVERKSGNTETGTDAVSNESPHCGRGLFGLCGLRGHFRYGHPGQHHGPYGHGPHGYGPHGHGPHGPLGHHGPHGHHGHGSHSPFGHHGPHGHGPHSPLGHHGPHGPFGHHGPHGHCHGPREGHLHGQGPLVPHYQSTETYYTTPVMFAHGTFTPYDSTTVVVPTDSEESDEVGDARKERKRAMKEMMKAAPKEMRKKMKAEFKDAWKAEKKFGKKCEKADKKCGEKSAKWDKKCCKKTDEWDKKCKKWDKKCKKDGDRVKARHVADVTIPDDSVLPADTPVTKTWRLRNPGEVAWPVGSQLVSKRENPLNGPERVTIEGPVLPQGEVEVSVSFLTPTEPGRYMAFYRMATPDGVKFGQRVWVSFSVAAAASIPTAPADALEIVDTTERVASLSIIQ